ncbi:hypothetical protein K435DRAFT_804155 [Dendrothele bispora CBS 962.96]|uniref:Uncharacterized protein n=1 Tax=Dendrothele bispora (strain CBS 962.96) TaxID=1314807 RepID=A0A4S8LFJ8_DENBC|nr:hypothetical protein K435DRAFT_804155 [Dendrothele bispora CBS 962.96]
MLCDILVAAWLTFFLAIYKVDARTLSATSQGPTSAAPSATTSLGDNLTAIVDDLDFSNIPERTKSGKLMLIAHIKITPVNSDQRYYRKLYMNSLKNRSKVAETLLIHRVFRIVDENANPTGEYISIEGFTGKQHLRLPFRKGFKKPSDLVGLPGKSAFLDNMKTPSAIELLKEVKNGLFLSDVIDAVDQAYLVLQADDDDTLALYSVILKKGQSWQLIYPI